jgi:cytochrome c biogenesis protein CcdA
MKKTFLILIALFLFGFSFVSAASDLEVSYFYSTTCTHCIDVDKSGIMDEVAQIENVTVTKYEITSPVNREKFFDYLRELGIENGGTPFVVIERGEEISYLMGGPAVINELEDSILNFQASEFGGKSFLGDNLTLGMVVIAALIDSINPCAFGVLLFLMAVLLSMGTPKKALKYGLIYSTIIFIVYLLAGVGIMKLIGLSNSLDTIKIVAGILILIAALIEIKDFFWYDKGFSLKIPDAAKPKLQEYVRKGTLPALIMLAVFVALVELPCTGAIYLAILSLIGDSGMIGLIYLLIYNIIFIAPLFVFSLII